MQPDVFKRLLAELDQANKKVYSPVRGETDPMACNWALAHDDTYAPWLP